MIDRNYDGVLTVDDCDDNNTNLLEMAGDMDCDGVQTGDDDNDINLGDITNDADCDGVDISIDCDEGDAGIGGDCSVCLDYFNLTSELIASNDVDVAPFIEGTSGRIPSWINSALYSIHQSISTDMFDDLFGTLAAFPSSDSVLSFHGISQYSRSHRCDETLHGSFTEMTWMWMTPMNTS